MQYNLRIETDIGVHALPVTKLKVFSFFLVNFLRTPEIIIFVDAPDKFNVYDNLSLLLAMSALKCSSFNQ